VTSHFGVNFAAAIVKGLVEHNDGTSYFGSLMGYQDHLADARARGWVDLDGKLTEVGRALYDKADLAKLPNKKFSRAYSWDWSGVSISTDKGTTT
jgi:hypothetical protein